MTDIDELVAQYGIALKSQAEAVSALSTAEANLDVIFWEAASKAEGAEWKAKASVKASSEYKAALHDVCEAREAVEKAKAEVEHLKTRVEVWRTKMSFEKQRMAAR